MHHFPAWPINNITSHGPFLVLFPPIDQDVDTWGDFGSHVLRIAVLLPENFLM